jgi:hypothetical protein
VDKGKPKYTVALITSGEIFAREHPWVVLGPGNVIAGRYRTEWEAEQQAAERNTEEPPARQSA